jgi:transketolase
LRPCPNDDANHNDRYGDEHAAITAARAATDQPSMIACKTIIGLGFPTKADTQTAHSNAPVKRKSPVRERSSAGIRLRL